MSYPLSLINAVLLLLLLAGCSSGKVYAPVDSRDTQQKKPQSQVNKPLARPDSDYYTVRRGDTLYSIAWQYGLKYKQLAQINRIRPPYTIYAGQRLRTRADVGGGASPPTTVAASTRSTRPAAGTASVQPSPRTAVKPGKVTPSQPPVATSPARPLPSKVNQWVWPVKGPLLDSYHPKAAGKKGIDIGGRKGQSVVAAADGRVVYSGSGLVGYGRLIIIKHTDSLLSAYGHNSSLLVAEGERVNAGQVIAKMGNSGTDRVQLYFEIRKDGKPVNPLRYLPRG